MGSVICGMYGFLVVMSLLFCINVYNLNILLLSKMDLFIVIE